MVLQLFLKVSNLLLPSRPFKFAISFVWIALPPEIQMACFLLLLKSQLSNTFSPIFYPGLFSWQHVTPVHVCVCLLKVCHTEVIGDQEHCLPFSAVLLEQTGT